MNLPIPPEQLPAVVTTLRADGVAYLNIEANQYTMPSAYTSLPVWRALADATCNHRARLMVESGTYPMAGCLDCRGTGKPIHTLSVECADWDADVHCRHHFHGQACCLCGARPVDVVVADLVPVELNQFASRDHSHIALTRDGEAHHVNAEGGHRRITRLGPPLTPGDWVAVLKAAAS